jgi:hypothetical protein
VRGVRDRARRLTAAGGVPRRLESAVACLETDTCVSSLPAAAVLAYQHGAGALCHPAALHRFATWAGRPPTWDVSLLPRWPSSRPPDPRRLPVVTTTAGAAALRAARVRARAHLHRFGVTSHPQLVRAACGTRLRLATRGPEDLLELLAVDGDANWAWAPEDTTSRLARALTRIEHTLGPVPLTAVPAALTRPHTTTGSSATASEGAGDEGDASGWPPPAAALRAWVDASPGWTRDVDERITPTGGLPGAAPRPDQLLAQALHRRRPQNPEELIEHLVRGGYRPARARMHVATSPILRRSAHGLTLLTD